MEVIENIESALPLFQIAGNNLFSVSITEKPVIKIISLPEERSDIEKLSKLNNALEIVDAPLKRKRQGVNKPKFRSKNKPNYAEKEAENKKLGDFGEKLVVKFEQKNIIESGRIDLVEEIKQIQDTLGDDAGYDIKSYTTEGKIKYIEVKTTRGRKASSFFMSGNERDFAKENKDNYFLYRVFEYHEEANTGKCFILRNIEDELDFYPIKFIVTFSN